MLKEIISENFIHALGWTVIHSLWQAIFIALGMALVLLALRKKTAWARYWVANIALILVLFTSAYTFFDLYQIADSHSDSNLSLIINEQTAAVLFGGGDASYFQQFLQQFQQYFNEHLPLIVMVWVIGAAFFVLRLFGGLAYVQYLKYNFNSPLSGYWEEQLEGLKNKININRGVELVESALVKVPMVIGYFKPIILLPIGIVNQLEQEQIEAILAHELAHIYRHDFLLNILQSVVEVLFYFNPAVWWISANIRTERENCCDDIAVRLCGSSLAYAKALVSIQEMNMAAPSFAMTFAGKRQKHQLLNRVKRILNQPQNKSNIMEKFIATCLLLGAIIFMSVQANASYDPLNENGDMVVVELETVPVIEKVIVQPHLKSHHITADTVPDSPKTFRKRYDDSDVEVTIKDGEVVKLKIDGKKIPKEEIDEHVGTVEDLFDRKNTWHVMPAPPAPPAPFAPAPAPDVEFFPVVPAPPAPPAPPSFNFEFDNPKIITKKLGEDGNTFMIIEGEGGVHELEFNDEDNTFYFDGEPLAPSNYFVYPDEDWNDWLEDNELDNFKGKLHFAIPDVDAKIADMPLLENFSEGTWAVPMPEINVSDIDPWMAIAQQYAEHLDTIPGGSEESRAAYDTYRTEMERLREEMNQLREQQQAIRQEYMQQQQDYIKEMREKMGSETIELREQARDLRDKMRKENMERARTLRELERDKARQARDRHHGQLEELRDKLDYLNDFSIQGNNLTWTTPNGQFYGYFDEYGIVNEPLKTAFEKELLEDNLISGSGAYYFEITAKKMIVNHKEQPQSTVEKYQKIYENISGSRLKGKDRIVINTIKEE